ncbi:MAG TPA: methyltransferase domain-containing protein [Syntrophorhabdales bacterium]|nr:methyltransferase domain-containing protein [Syntrophorhabdales bacterium]
MLKLHLGCWKRRIPGFVHVDLYDFPHIDYKHDVSSLPMFSDQTVDLIYASHVLEYFDREEVRAVLSEWRRILKYGGILRVAVPDFPSLIEVYQKAGNLSSILGPLYGRMEIVTSERIKSLIYHKTTYDFDSLKETLEACGYADIHRYDWRETIHKDYDDHSQAYYPHMDKEHGLLISLNVEGARQ